MRMWLVGGLAVLVAIAVYFGWRSGQPTAPGAYDGLAKCLTSKGVKMYGAYWCPHCQNQKAEFGSSFQYVDYVECTQRASECDAAGVKGYPTWIFPDGHRLEGEQTLEKLAQDASCTVQ